MADLQREWDATLRHVSRARFEAGDRYDASPAGKAAALEVSAKLKVLEVARSQGAPLERLDASSAYVKAKMSALSARERAVAADAHLIQALSAADRAHAQVEQGRELAGLTRTAGASAGIADSSALAEAGDAKVDFPHPAAAKPGPAVPSAPEDYRIEAGKSFGGMKIISVTFSTIYTLAQTESVLRNELLSSVDKTPPSGDVVIDAWDENHHHLKIPDGSTGLVYVAAEEKIKTLREWTASRHAR